MKLEITEEDSLKVSDETPMYNPQALPLHKLKEVYSPLNVVQESCESD